MNNLLPDPQLATQVLEVIFHSYRQAKQGASHNCIPYSHTCVTPWFVFFFLPQQILQGIHCEILHKKPSLHLTIG